MKKLTALAALALLLLTQRPHAQGAGLARIYFVDIGQGAGTLIVGPTGRTLLVDGGPPGGGTTKIIPLLNSLGITQIDFTVVTHYHIDHISGITELLEAGRVAGIAYDNGDGADVQPPNAGGTRTAYANYITATGATGVSRQTIQPGQVIDLGGGMRATCIVAGGRLLSRGAVPITNQDLNSESISLLVEYNDFDYLVSGDLTGGGSTSTAKTPDVETYVGQIVGDLDVVQVNHHGSTTTSNQTFLAAVKAEVAVAQASDDNTFGHPHRETVNKYLNTPVTNGHTFALPAVPLPGSGPVFYQPEASVAGDDRVTTQAITGAGAGAGGHGTIRLQTDGTTTFTMRSVDDGGVRINEALHTYAVDGASAGVTTNFPPTVIAETSPILPLASEPVTVTAAVSDRESSITRVVVSYALNGTPASEIAMTLAGGVYQATIPAQPDGTRVDYTIAGTSISPSAGAQTTTFSAGYFAGVTPIASLRASTEKGEPLYAGYAARIQGTVTASGFSGPATNDDYVQDPTGAINVFKSTDGPTVFTSTAPGQIVEARGRIGFTGGRLRLDLTESVEKIASPFGVSVFVSGPAPAPVATTIATLSSNPESFEGQFVSIANLSIVSGSIPSAPQSLDSFVTVSDGTGSFSLKIDDDADLEGFTPAATFTAAGIIQQDDFLRPFDAGYNITPRSRIDIGGPPPPVVPLLTIADARIDAVRNATGAPGADFIPDRVGETVKVRGAVTSTDFRGGTGIEYYVQDPSGGIDLFSTSLSPSFAIGDNVEAVGLVTHFNGLTELTLLSITPLGGTTATAPAVVTLAQLGDGGAGEAFEGRLVRIDHVLVTGGTFPGPSGSGNITLTDATGTGTLRVDGDTDIDGTPTPAGTVSVTGVVGQFASTPFNSGYQLLPRFTGDIEAAGCAAIAIGGTPAGGTVGVGYAQTVTASGGTGPYTFSISAGTLPSGLVLSAAGVLSGTPTADGTFTFAVRAVAADGCLAVAPRSVTIVNPTPMLVVSPAAIPFGLVAIGASRLATVTLTNSGSATLTLATPFTISGADAAHFQAGGPGTTTLAAGASTTVSVTFQPTTSGPKSATLTIAASGGASGTASLTGTGTGSTGSAVVISEFRTRGPVGGNDEFVEIYNNSDTPVDISGWKLMGSSNTAPTGARATVPNGTTLRGRAHFLFVNTAASGYSGTVPGNVSYTTGVSDNGGIALTMPDTTTIIDQVGVVTINTGYREGTALTTQLTTNTNRSYERKPGGLALTLQDTEKNVDDFQLLNGVTAVPNPQNLVLTATTARIDFGGVMPPDTAAQLVTVKNVLLTSIELNVPVVVSGADASAFSAGAPSTTTLAPGATATILVTFQPGSAGVTTASLSITSSNGGSVDVLLGGTSLPGIIVSPPSIDFGSVALGSSAPATVTISNGNPTDVTLTPPFVISGTDAAEFSVAGPGATTLAGNSETTTTVTFQPASLGNKAASLVITSTNGGTRTIALSGLASCPAIAVTGSLPTGEFGAVYAGAVSASGGAGGYAFSVSTGALPTGLTLNESGTVSGTPAALGTSAFTVQAADVNGCTGTADFAVLIVDTTPPTLTLPANITAEATGATTSIGFGATAIDMADPSPVVTCAPSSGFAFPVGTTTVDCTAADAQGNRTSGRFTVTITDLTAPVLTLPGDLAATATAPSGAVVSYTASASDLVDGPRPVACVPASGSTFAIGSTPVSCTATDGHANRASGRFLVTVNVAPQPGRMIGDGKIEIGSTRHEFEFLVQERASGADGGVIRYRVNTHRQGREQEDRRGREQDDRRNGDQEDRFEAVVTNVAFFNVAGVSPGRHPPASGVDTVTFGGAGRWNGRSGYTFVARAIDAGEPGRGHDSFAMTVRDAGGQIVAAVDATIVSGNIQSLRIGR